MLSGANAFEISDIQQDENKAVTMSYLGRKPLNGVFGRAGPDARANRRTSVPRVADGDAPKVPVDPVNI